MTESAEDIEAARKAYFAIGGTSIWSLALWNDPVFLGHYPENAPAAYGANWPKVSDADLKLIAQPLDFMGHNCYSGNRFQAGPDGQPKSVPFEAGNAIGALGWLHVVPDALYWAARFQAERYGNLPFVVTERLL